MRRITGVILAFALGSVGVAEAASPAASLRGSPAAMIQQNRVAKDHGFDFYRTPQDIRDAVARGELVELTGDENYEVADFVRFPYLQPEVRLFVERLAAQYRAACGQKLVVTSAVRPSSGQPANAHQLSVHPAGMAVDLRVSDRASCRSWLEGTLLNLERRGVLNGIREFHPPHYHVAVFPEQYMEYVGERLAIEAAAAEAADEPQASTPTGNAAAVVSNNVAGAAALLPGGATADAGAAAESRSSSPKRALLVALLALPLGLRVMVQRNRRR